MLYAQFYQKAVWPIGSNEIIEACGDRSVIIIDGRLSRGNIATIANEECIRRGYLGYRLFKGESFTRSNPIGEYITVK